MIFQYAFGHPCGWLRNPASPWLKAYESGDVYHPSTADSDFETIHSISLTWWFPTKEVTPSHHPCYIRILHEITNHFGKAPMTMEIVILTIINH